MNYHPTFFRIKDTNLLSSEIVRRLVVGLRVENSLSASGEPSLEEVSEELF